MIQPQNNFSNKIYLFGIALLALSLSWSEFLMSLSQIILALVWLADKNLLSKIKYFFQNKIALIISSVFVLHLLGLLYTTDFTYGSEDLRKKIPLFLLPLIFSTSPALSKKNLNYILQLFALSTVLASFVCFYVLLGYGNKIILQHRDASIFISHIRFSLLLVMALFTAGYFFVLTKGNMFLKLVCTIVALWILFFMLSMEMTTGIICIGVISFLLLVYSIYSATKTGTKIVAAILLITCMIAPLYFIYSTLTPISINPLHIPAFTQNGNTYSNDSTKYETENGYRVWVGICETELRKEWNKKSKINYDSSDLRKNEIKYTLIRFLTSKGNLKDSASVAQLSDKETSAIEKGIPNIDNMKLFNPRARIKQIAWEVNKYMHRGNPSGHSVIQRFEYWKTAIRIIKQNILFGVGTGDVETTFANEYNKSNSPLTKDWRLRSHNQYLAIAVAFGATGLLWFLFTLLYPLFKEKKIFDYFYFVFFITASLSFLTEDTLETQAGVTFFAFFNSLLLFSRQKEDHTESYTK